MSGGEQWRFGAYRGGAVVTVDLHADRPDGGSRFICEATPADAERIIESVNAHPRLTAELAEARATIARLTETLEWYAGYCTEELEPLADAPAPAPEGRA